MREAGWLGGPCWVLTRRLGRAEGHPKAHHLLQAEGGKQTDGGQFSGGGLSPNDTGHTPNGTGQGLRGRRQPGVRTRILPGSQPTSSPSLGTCRNASCGPSPDPEDWDWRGGERAGAPHRRGADHLLGRGR